MNEFTEETFAIDLLSDFHKTTNPETIKEKALEDLDLELTISQIKDYLNREDDYEMESRYVQMKDIFT